MSAQETHAAVQREILGEKAGALARVVESLEGALADYAEAVRAAREHPSPRAEARRREALAHAGERLWIAVIQREAMGLLRHEVLHDVLRVPREVRLAMGPRRR
jgi:hypothetical protein